MNIVRNVAGAVARNWKISVPAAGVCLAGLAWLAFGYFGVQTAFIDDEVEEALPEFDLSATSVESASGAADPAAVDDAAVGDAAVDGGEQPESASTESVEPSAAEPGVDAPVDASADAEAAVGQPAEPVVAEIAVEASGLFSGTSRYDVTGEAAVLGNGTGQRFLRFEDFESSNGPDLFVYLFNPDDRSDYVDLGELKGNIGDQNYEVPVDVDLTRYSEVSIWCLRFSTSFGSADLVAA